ncbi:MAG: subclass B1 metallo-beta-lactamase [Leadbetterella sp.]|nr:subclass B1 metallo-beta-lactamase [Leadbetterella sp.]
MAVAFIALSFNSPKQEAFEPKEIYRSDDLVIIQISENAFEHVSYLQTQDFGNVPCNGLVVRDGHETLVFDTPTNDKSAAELIRWVTDSLHCKINAVIPTHFHNDCLGGLKPFHDKGVPSYAYARTVELAKENGYVVPQNIFSDSLILKVGKEKIITKFFGEGHTRDNVVGYFPAEKVMFGGCLIKELNAGKGYLGDANVTDWPATVEKVKQAYPDVTIVVPGHGKYGDSRLLDYTIKLFITP